MTAEPTMTPFVVPTRRDEAWRYSDIAALEAAQSLPAVVRDPVAHTLSAGDTVEATIDTAAGATHAREEVRLAANAEAIFVHRLRGEGWLNLDLDVAFERGRLTHILIQDRSAEALATATIKVALGAEAHYDLFVFQAGARFGRVAVEATLAGAGARFDAEIVQLAVARQTLETVTRIAHAAPDSVSRQTVRTVLGGHAVGSYLGKVLVERDAQRTDAAQDARAIILDRAATANVKPELEIYADDVKCAHGAAIGELDESALFYLAARGIDPATARAVLIEAFVADQFEEIADEAARAAIGARARQWLHEVLA